MGSRPERVNGHIGIENGPDSYGRQQLRIFHNGRKPDGATPRERFGWRNKGLRECGPDDVKPGISPG